MRYALVGYGRMGREIEQQAARRGHRLEWIVDPGAAGDRVRPRFEPGLGGVDVAFEFTRPEQAEANVVALLESGAAVICGTTGWEISERARGALDRSESGAVIAPNFSVGMNLFYQIVEEASRRMCASGLYDPFVLEWHHRGKLDAPSGTARRLASILSGTDPRRWRIQTGNPEGALPGDAIHVASLRAGHEPGTHTVGFDGEFDGIRLEHRARGRAAFAMGAVLAGEWIVGRAGLHRFDEVLGDLLAAGGGEQGR